MDLVGLQPAHHDRAAGVAHHLGLDARRHTGHRGGSGDPGPPRHQVLPVEALRDATPGAELPSARRALIGAGILWLGIGGIGATL